MIKVYTANTPNGIKIPIALDEMGVEYELILLNLGERDQKTDEFLRINPNGRIPAIVDESVIDEKGRFQTVFESGAILLYLAEKFEALLGSSAQDRAATLEWLFFQMGGVGPMFGQVNFFKGSEKYPSENAVARFLDESKRLVSVLELRLQMQSWLAGKHYTIADIANYGWLKYSEGIGIDLTLFPAVQRWLDAVAKRPAVASGIMRIERPDKVFQSDEVLVSCSS